MAAQHLPGGLVWPRSGSNQAAQTVKTIQNLIWKGCSRIKTIFFSWKIFFIMSDNSDFWSNRQIRSYCILVSLFISFQMKSCKMLCSACRRSKGHHTTENIVTRSLKKIVNNFEITNKRVFNIAGRMFKPDKRRLTDRRLATLLLSTTTNILINV